MSTKIYVGNMAFETNQSELESAFGAYGSVESVNLITDRETGRPRGFGFVEMSDSDEAEAAIEGLNETDLGGRCLVVNKAKPRNNRSW